jgi:DNA polymerase I-like protein with 3'-5' exonuclease and polymerase domains
MEIEMNDNYTYITDPGSARNALMFIDMTKPIGIDIETTALKPWNGEISTVQVSDGRDTSIFDILLIGKDDPSLNMLKALIANPNILKIAHNAKFEIGWFVYHFGIEPEMFFDTFLASRVISEGLMPADHDLASVAFTFTGKVINKFEQASDWSVRPLTAEQLRYAAVDAEVVTEIYPEQIKRLAADDLLFTAAIEFDAIKPIAKAEINGMHLDADMWSALLEVKKAELATLHDEMQAFLAHGVDWKERNPEKKGHRPTKPKKPVDPRRAKANKGREISESEIDEYLKASGQYLIDLVEWQRAFEAWESLPDEVTGKYNPNSVQQTVRLLKNVTGLEFGSTRSDFLEEYSDDHPEVAKLLEYRGAAKLVSSYGENFLAARDESGRVHTDFDQIKDTGRMGSRNVNLQQVPHEEEYRACFTAPPGKKLIIADYSTIELRILAQFSADPVFVSDFFGEIDLHTKGAMRFFRLQAEEVDPDRRYIAKRTNFGVVFGIGDNKLGRQIGLEWHEAGRIKKAYFTTYPGNDSHLKLANRQAQEFLIAVTSSGRKQRFTHDGSNGQISGIGRNGQNTPIQGTAADILKRALYLLDIRLAGTSGKVVNIVHDEIVAEADERDAEKVKEILTATMIEAAKMYITRVPVEVEAKVASNWAEK